MPVKNKNRDTRSKTTPSTSSSDTDISNNIFYKAIMDAKKANKSLYDAYDLNCEIMRKPFTS